MTGPNGGLIRWHVYCIACAGKDYPVQASTRDEMLVWVSAIDDARVCVARAVRVCTDLSARDTSHF